MDFLDLSIQRLIFILANWGITTGYILLAVKVMPRARPTLKRTRYGGFGFFLLCSLTHAEMGYGALRGDGLTLAHMLSWHMMVIHVLQLVSIWAFVSGLYIEYGRAAFDGPQLSGRDGAS